MMTEPVEEMQKMFEEHETRFGDLQIGYCGEYQIGYKHDGEVRITTHIAINAVRPNDEFAGGVCLPFYYDQKLSEEDKLGESSLTSPSDKLGKWLEESEYGGMEFKRIDEVERKKNI